MEIKIIVSTKDLVKKAKFFLKNLTDWHDESLQCCCHTITRSRLKLSWSLPMFTLLYSPWDPYKLCWKKKIVFSLKVFYFSICLTSNKLYWIEDQLTDVSTGFYMSVSWHWRVEPSVTWLDTHMTAGVEWKNKGGLGRVRLIIVTAFVIFTIALSFTNFRPEIGYKVNSMRALIGHKTILHEHM